jgi:dimethylamine/trimethylamine dehydrogenase
MDANRYSCLFEPVRIGPVTAPNRFYATPHTDGMSRAYARGQAKFREVKAEGGWGVVATQEVVFDPKSDCTPDPDMVLYDDTDVITHRRIADSIHAHGALAATELVHLGLFASCRWSRETPIGPSHRPMIGGDPANGPDPISARAMSLADISDFRRAHRRAAIAMMDAGYDIVYVYASHSISLLSHFLSPFHNERHDSYGGSLENRMRLLREVIEDTKDAIGHRCAVAVRFGIDVRPDAVHNGEYEESRETLRALAELPDLWDVNLAPWDEDSVSARFAAEGFQEQHIAWVKQATTKPVVIVGRYTSPDAMVSAVRRGLSDFIGAARPSIADPFLPNKVREGRVDEIRECIGCNMCVATNNTKAPIRCTQNPTVGEEWRRGWHPEHIEHAHADHHILVVGAGPAGLEAALQLGRRGYRVTLADGADRLGGRLLRESKYPSLGTWRRVVDWREHQLRRMPAVEVFLESQLTAAQVLDVGADHVLIATGSSWRRDGIGPTRARPIPIVYGASVLTPEDTAALRALAAGKARVMIYDDEQFYTAGALAEQLAIAGATVALVTPGTAISAWTKNTLEQPRIQNRLLRLGVELYLTRSLLEVRPAESVIACTYTDRASRLAADAFVLVTARLPIDSLATGLLDHIGRDAAARVPTVSVIGDAVAPSTIAAAVHSGHRAARLIGRTKTDELEYRRETAIL